jgi:glycosyltransferase involved in cell wall biosynthesis
MLRRQGFEVVLYAGEENEADVDEHVPLLSESRRQRYFGAGFDTVKTVLEWDARAPYFRRANARAIREIRARTESQRDLVLLTTGWPQQPIADGLPELNAVEWTVGYEGISTRFCAFESHVWRHHVYGLEGWRLGRFYDATIPNFFDPADFELDRKSDYLLFVGRLVERKGPHVALQIAERVGLPLLVCGPGATSSSRGLIEYDGGVLAGNVAYAGVLDREARMRLMAGARALLVPTLYLEPFGGVAVEAMLSGTPAVTTDFGAFVETVEPGVTGYRFRTLAEAEVAVRRALDLDPAAIRARAVDRYGWDAIGAMYADWFSDVDGLNDGVGWSA